MPPAGDVPEPIDPWGVVAQRLRPQRVRPDQLPRDELVQRLRTIDVPVVVLRAPAGYGKSTTLSRLAATDDRSVAWITLDPADADPVVLVRHLVRALALGGVDVSAVERRLATAEPDLWNVVLADLAHALSQPEVGVLLLVDELQLLRDGAADVLDRVLDLVPDGSAAVLAGRGPGGLHVARRVLAGGAVELDERDLVFDEREARSLVRAELPELPEPLVDELLRTTERWPAGLHLGVLALRDHPDPAGLLGGMLAADRRVVDYLQQEVLSRLDPDVRSFLTDISVLARPSGPLCDAITGRTDSAVLLAELVESGNLFISPVLDTPDVYRIHQLFAELLLTDLRRDDAGRETELRRRAASWKDAHGEPDAAVRQALLAGELELASRIVHRHHAAVIYRGELPTLQRWIGSFPGDVVASDGLLALAAGWAALITGDASEFSHHLGTARKLHVDGPLPDGTATYELAVEALSMIASVDGVEETARSATILLDAGPGASPWWALARLQWAVARVTAGLEDPIEALGAVEIDTRGRPSVHLVALAQLALAHLSNGDLATADRLSRASVREAEEHGLSGYSLVGMFHCVASLVAARLGEPERSRTHADAAAGLLVVCDRLAPRAAIQARQVLADAALARHDLAEAGTLLRAAAHRLHDEPGATSLQATQERLEARQASTGGQIGGDALSDAELRVLRLLPTHLSMSDIGAELYISRNTVKTHASSIYRKLGATGRGEAVAVARERGVLDDVLPPAP